MDATEVQQLVSDYEDSVATCVLSRERGFSEADQRELYEDMLRLRRQMFAALNVEEPEESRQHEWPTRVRKKWYRTKS